MQIKKGRKKHTGESFFSHKKNTRGGKKRKREKKHLRRARKTREKKKKNYSWQREEETKGKHQVYFSFLLVLSFTAQNKKHPQLFLLDQHTSPSPWPLHFCVYVSPLHHLCIMFPIQHILSQIAPSNQPTFQKPPPRHPKPLWIVMSWAPPRAAAKRPWNATYLLRTTPPPPSVASTVAAAPVATTANTSHLDPHQPSLPPPPLSP